MPEYERFVISLFSIFVIVWYCNKINKIKQDESFGEPEMQKKCISGFLRNEPI